MAKTLVTKILEDHLVEGELVAGEPIGIRIDQTLTQDITGTMAMMEYEAMGAPAPATDLSVNYTDHNLMQLGFENADDHEFLRTFSAARGMRFSKPGNGICHQVHLERFSVPGKTLLGADSHTPTSGGAGMVAIGAGGLDVACAIAGAPFYLTCPKVLEVRLAGRLQPFVGAKDVILKLLAILSTKGNVGWMVEYTGPGAKTLSVPERATIANMGAELGVTSSVFPSDKVTRRFLAWQGREDAWRPLKADRGAAYDRTIEIDLARVEPMVACPHSPGNVRLVRETGGLAVNQVCIGSCTNSSVRDLLMVAAMLKGRRARPEVGLVVAPGSRQVLQTIARAGALEDLIAAGARIDEAACGFCIGAAQAPQTDAVSVRTSNRNFEGRSGTKSARVYLVSPETAAACALTGRLTDPRDLGIAHPRVREPRRLAIDDSMILAPAAAPDAVEVFRGPNQVGPPPMEALPDRLAGRVALAVGDSITTDHIMPAGKLTIYRSNVPKYAEFVFSRVDPDFASRCAEARDAGKANFIVAGESYGQGSSREHAALCPRVLGVRAVLAKSIERIHQANLVNFGILPLVFAGPADAERVGQGDELELADLRTAVAERDTVTVRNVTRGTEFAARLHVSPRERRILLAGGVLNLAGADARG
ncbi:MAG: aconitate hydratase [Planctomycetes bacterium SM23_25]|nr:MAG: aconitate hydratase [Planctomycetes bacterium SM23_25]